MKRLTSQYTASFFRSSRRLATVFIFPLLLSGCYTQLYTGGYLQRPSEVVYRSVEGDTLRPGDSLSRQTVFIENNYNAYYGVGYANPGYSYANWEYPYFYLGLSTGYSDYYGPYWYDRPGYYGGYRNRHYGGHPTYNYPPTPGGSGGSNSYQSDKRLFSAPSSIPRPGKTDRAGSPASNYAPAPKATAGSGGSYTPPPTTPANTDGGDAHPPVRKGQRR